MIPIVEFEKVVKIHGSVVAVDHVSLNIKRGEFFSILGPSGSGKTSILRLIAGLDVPDSGTITLEQRVVNADPPHARPVNMVFQQYALFPHMTVFDNIAFGLTMRGQTKNDIRMAVERMTALVHLEGKTHRLPAQLSGGEQQRVALARALVNSPAVLLLDEPLAALDQQLRQEMQEELKRVQREVAGTFICVTHQQDEALMLSDRIGVMHRGKLLQVGTPQEVYERPTSLTVAKFVGLSNALSGKVLCVEKGICWVEPEGCPVLMAACLEEGLEQESVTIVVRPERLHIATDLWLKKYDNTLSACVKSVVFQGNEFVYQFQLQNDHLWTARVPIHETHTGSLDVGQTVYLQWAVDEGLALMS